MKRLLLTVGMLSLFLLLAVSWHGESVRGQTSATTSSSTASDLADGETCREKIVTEFGKVHDAFRATVFGARRESDEGDAFLLTGGRVDETLIGTGILATRQRLTSEFVEPMVESYRVLRCRSLAVCKAMEASFEGGGNNQISPWIPGCETRPITTYAECDFSDEDEEQPRYTSLHAECLRLHQESLEAQQAVLRLSMSYDTGYRSALQLGGMIDWMQGDFPSQVIKPIRDMTNLLGKLHEIPCFVGQCDHPNRD
jgi:hypothetical protein